MRKKKWFSDYFANSSNCFDDTAKIPELTNVVIEIGAGAARLSLELAQKFPENNYVAVDLKEDRLARGAKFAIENDISNIIFLWGEVLTLANRFSLASVKEIWITFPDPYPKNKDRSKRLVSLQYAMLYKQLLEPRSGKLYIKTDDVDLFNQALKSFLDQGAQICEKSNDLHSSDLDERYKIQTVFEDRFVREGKPINFASIMF
jgi:tRNA (guanine-N7-)-methyltransferase